jgi:hypothetical protein
MSIFKSTLKPEIAAQLKAREKIISQTSDSGVKDKKGNPIFNIGTLPRDSNFLRFAAGKNSWVRMVSFVDADYGCKKIKNSSGEDIINPTTNKPKVECLYTGNQLAKKYILEGGTLYNSGKEGDDTFSLRRGVNKTDGVYGSNIDRISNTGTTLDRPLGLRPMPGITSLNVTNKSAYGSLREATVEYYCWDKHQLEEIELLYMRPGYSVMLEWGWSQYLDHGVANDINKYPDNISIKNFDLNTIDAFKAETEDYVYSQIDELVSKSKGNYDAILGLVKNFSWQLMPNGGYRCTTILISRGEVLETIKASSNPNIILGSTPPPAPVNIDGTTVGSSSPIFTLFERIFLTIKAAINKSEITNPDGEIRQQIVPKPNPEDPNTPPPTLSEDAQAQLDKFDTYASETYNSIKSNLEDQKIKYKFDMGDQFVDRNFNLSIAGLGLVRLSEASTDGTGIEYMNMKTFIVILNRFFIPRNKETGDPLLYLVIPEETTCLMSEDSVSIDPTICLISNDLATFITDSESTTDQQDRGFNPLMFNGFTFDPALNSYKAGSSYVLPSFYKQDAIKQKDGYKVVSVGKIGNIYISIGKILEVYRKYSGGENGVDITKLLTELLEDISFALGGINDFKLYTNRNIIQIIDAKYLETGEGASSKFMFDTFGLKSICRDVKINSRIFSEQSTMIGIAAGSSGNVKNLGDIYASTQTYFNEGLSDRIKNNLDISTSETAGNSSILDKDGKEIEANTLYYYNIYNNVSILTGYINKKILGDYTTKYNVSTANPKGIRETRIPQQIETSNASNLLKTFHYQINGKDVNFKSIIPFELELTLDGIGGFIIGQIFRIDKDMLPRSYYNSNVGFIITGISHSLQSNDWITTLKTQMCLLDNEAIELSIDKNKLKQVIQQIKTQIKGNSYLVFAMADYLVYQTLRTIGDNNPTLKEPFLEGNKKLTSSTISFDRVKADDAVYIFNALTSTTKALTFDEYLTLWFNKASQNPPPDFPATLAELKEVTVYTGQKLQTEILTGTNFYRGFFIKDLGSDKYKKSIDQSRFVKESDFKSTDIFLFRIFGDEAGEKIKNDLTTIDDNPDTVTYYGTIVKSINLQNLYLTMLNAVNQNVIQSNETFSAFIDITAVEKFSQEIDIKNISKNKIIYESKCKQGSESSGCLKPVK